MLTPRALAQPGALDPTFGDGGVVLVQDARFDGVGTLPGGQVVATGRTYPNPGPSVHLGAGWRFLHDGSPDPAFGDDGQGETISGVFGAFFNGAHVHSTGRLFAAGSAYGGFGANVLLARYEPDGQVSAFPGEWGGGAGVLLELDEREDGRIVVFGSHDDVDSGIGCSIREYAPDGDQVGVYWFSDADVSALGVGFEACHGGSLLDDESTEVYFHGTDPSGEPIGGVARFLEDGVLDGTYGNGGVSLAPLGFKVTAGTAEPGGSVVVTGLFGGVQAAVRLTPEGVPDPAFGEGGVAVFPNAGAGIIHDVVRQPDGKLLLAGVAEQSTLSDGSPFVARVLANGSLDPTFGLDGVTILEVEGVGPAVALAVDQADRIVVAGWATDNATQTRVGFVARLLNDGGVASEPSVPPKRLTLSAPAPNPASGPIALAYTLAEPDPVSLAVYDVLGRAVAVLAEGTRPAGRHEATFDTSRLAPGLYVVRLTAGGEVATRRLTVVR